jgi:hypothetical protein
MNHGLASFNERGEVKNSVKGLTLALGRGEKVFKSWPVCQLSLDKIDSGRQKLTSAMPQIVKNYRLMAIFGQQTRNGSTDVPRTASNQDLHENLSLSASIGLA